MITVHFDITPDATEEGPFDPEQVFMQYLCNTGPGGQHDAAASPDDHVRPMHAALHGKVFKLNDPLTPVPPLDFGCRCALRYVGKADSIAERVFGIVAPTAPTTRAAAYVEWLDANADGWRALIPEVAAAPAVERLSKAWDMAVAAGIPDPRDVARMVVDAITAGAVTEPK